MYKALIAKYLIVIFILCNSFRLVLSRNQLKQIHIVFRHGERSPTETYKSDPHINFTWSGGWGQLTNRGKFQMYSLGIKLRNLYKNFIPEYYFHEDVRVLSSYADRCLMSAEALLAGLFPPKNEQIWNENLLWQPIVVNYTPRSQDNMIAMKAKCDKYDKEFIQVFQSEAIKKIDAENADLYKYLTESTNQVVNNIGSVEKLYNTLEIEMLNNLTLPSWTKNVSLEHLRKLAARNLAAFTETDFMMRMKGGVFLKEVVSTMKNRNKPVIYLYSAHDLTLVNILRTLGVDSFTLKPGFGASLIFEFDESSHVKMIYRDDVEAEDEIISLPNCKDKCSLDEYSNALQDVLPVDWEQECKE